MEGREAATGGGATSTVSPILYDFLGDTEVSVGGTRSRRADDVWGSLGVGGTFSWGDGAYAIYGEGLVRTSLGDLGDSYANTATVGFRMAW